MIKSVTPLGDRILIKPIEEGEKKYGAILLADMGQERPEIGKIIAIGTGRTTETGARITPDDFDIKVGDVVLIPKIGTIRVEIESEEYYVTPFKEILGKVEYEADDTL